MHSIFHLPTRSKLRVGIWAIYQTIRDNVRKLTCPFTHITKWRMKIIELPKQIPEDPLLDLTGN